MAEVVHLASPQRQGPVREARRRRAHARGAGRASAGLRGRARCFWTRSRRCRWTRRWRWSMRWSGSGCGLSPAATAEPEAAMARAGGSRARSFTGDLPSDVVRIPALSERPEDIPVLFRHYVAQAAEQAGLTPPEITEEVIAGLHGARLARQCPRALMCRAMRFALGFGDPERPEEGMGLAERMAQVERSLLIEALRRAGGQARAGGRGAETAAQDVLRQARAIRAETRGVPLGFAVALRRPMGRAGGFRRWTRRVRNPALRAPQVVRKSAPCCVAASCLAQSAWDKPLAGAVRKIACLG